MRLKRYTAENMQAAIRLIKNELGPEAVILSTRKIKKPDGTHALEITAAMDKEPEAEQAQTFLAQPAFGTANSPFRKLQAEDVYASQPQNSAPTAKNSGALAQVLAAHGVQAELRHKITKAADALAETGFTPTDALEMVLSKLVQVVPPAAALPKRRLHLFVGPTGAGKTTSISKLAVQKKMTGAKIALLSLDFQKVAGYDQLATFAGAMNEKAYLIRSADDLAQAQAALATADYILIDTPGINPFKPQQVQALWQRVQSLGLPVTTHLVLPASMDAQVLQACPAGFALFQPEYVLFTKVDETLRFGQLINLAAESGLKLCYMADGAQVPDDLVEMDSHTLAQKLTTAPKMPW